MYLIRIRKYYYFSFKKQKKIINILLISMTINFYLILWENYTKKINSIIREGGSKIINSFIENNLWDEIRYFSCIKELKKELKLQI